MRESYKERIINPGSERGLISICLKNPDKIMECDDAGLYAEHFGVVAHKHIYMAMWYLYSKSVKPTPLAVLEVLTDKQAKQDVEEIGGYEYLSTMQQTYIKEDNWKIFVNKIKQSYTRRLMYEMCNDVMDEVTSDKAETMNQQELLSLIEDKLATISVDDIAESDVYKIGDDTEEVLRQRAEQPNNIPGLETGYSKFDSITNGGQPGDLIMICARAKCGKSTLLTNIATRLSIVDISPVLYIDTEMNAREQEDRILALMTGIPHREIVNGMFAMDTEYGMADEKIAKLKDASMKLRKGNYYHIYMPNFTIDKVTALTRKFRTQKNIEALFFDYLKLPASQISSLRSAQEYQMLGFMASGLKDIAGTLGIPVYSACQENRSNVNGEEKDASNVGGSDRILQLATKLMFLYIKSDESIMKEGIAQGNTRLKVAFQRNGESDCEPINYMFHKHILRFEEV